MITNSVLIVDDEISVYDFLQIQLEKQGARIIYAQNGIEALRVAAEILPDVILLDVMMPDMDGFETCRRLRSNPVLADVPIVMITALDDADSHLQGFKAGVDDFFTKPVDQILLLTRIQNILRMNRYRKQIEERANFAKELETKNLLLRELTQNLLEIQETERRFIAAELHDDMGQILTGLKLMLEMASVQSGDDLKNTLEKSTSIVSELSVRIRNLSLDLRPAMLDDFGLFAALEWLFERFCDQTQIIVEHNFSFRENLRFSKPIETAAFRIIQESLTNAARYAESDRISVNISVNSNLEIIVRDYGQGFDPSIIESKKYQSNGISSMRERVSLLDGVFSIRSTPGKGTTVKAVFNLT